MVGQQADAMANPEHLAKLKGGVETWNRWRKDNPKVKPDLSEADFHGADLSDADLCRTNLTDAKLPSVSMARADLSDADLSRTDLTEAKLPSVSMARAELLGAKLAGAHLTYAEFHSANLSYADLGGALLAGALLVGTKLRGANLRKALVVGSYFHECELVDSDLTNARIVNTVFANTDLSRAKGLEAVVFDGPSTIGIDTIFRSKGKIPEVFLRGCGVPDEFITFAKSLVTSPIEFYSCFISYSTKDQEYADRLYADLQNKGVRCWFALEDLRIGDRFQERIEESIRLYDKLLVVLSENSVNSPWVEREVQAAFEKEQRQGSTVLFPVRLDDAVMECPRAWAADIRRTRHIGDFRKWKDHDAFQKSLDRLLRDLKSQDSKPK